MRRIWSHLAALRLAWKIVHPVDKGLLLFMLLLLAQSTFSMFFPGDAPQLSSDIDVVVRTSSAAIFGYFLSANFVGRHFEKGQAPKEMESTFEDATGEQALPAGNSPIGFCLPDPKSQENQLDLMDGQVSSAQQAHRLLSDADLTAQQDLPDIPLRQSDTGGTEMEALGAQTEKATPEDSCPSCLQVAVAMGIGLFCLCALLLLRNLVQLGIVSPEFDSVQATVIQFRDFISGCVGFLIGTPTAHPPE